LTYIGPDGGKHRPVMVHRVILGAIERFMGVLIEHYAGAFPVWLAPVQAILVTVTDRQLDFARSIQQKLQVAGMRVELDQRNEKLGFKIREAQLQKVPYMLVVGDREVEAGGIRPRLRDGRQLELMTSEDFVGLVEQECREATGGRVGLGIV
ncbi:MAG TPA: threonine--tRNA ligase, partial [Syntrophobacteraceae bacterium]|nr:threonine--tRNA ligase [Syntrophobacteraceae bacterium]